MAITFFADVSVPTDNGTNVTNPTAFANPPIASMVAGDLVVVYAWCRTASATIAVSNAGGQSWTSFTSTSSGGATLSANFFYCRFNGTWSAAPSFSFGATTNNCVWMLVFRPTNSSNTWGIDFSAGFFSSFGAAATITVLMNNGISNTTIHPSTVSLAFWSTDDDNTWGTLTGTGWTKTGLVAAQVRNTSGSDASATAAWNIQTSVSTNNVPNPSQTELTLGNDGGLWFEISFYEITGNTNLLPFCIAPQPTR